MNMSIKLDRIDLNILAQVQKSGRIANVDLADAVGLSASPCLARLKKLEKAGYITGYSGLINLNKLGEFLIVYTEVTLTNHRANDFSLFEKKTRKIEEVLECHLISGGYDYLLKFATRGVTQYQEIMEYMLEGDFGIEKYFSYIVIKSPFVKHHYPIKSLFGDKN
ncbi:MAG: AsnC family transcriptional regulator [Woeseiaceae bacterium]|nr:AsnC family transcriptional regulator [Woeseiaceae bacterium]|tara:strand:- start:5964 stop:6458 length:495 start_codon:yes stop_codon:yes gene_type:complete